MTSNLISSKSKTQNSIEPLEQRIAPAAIDANTANIHAVVGGSDILLHAGEILSTADGGGSYLLYVSKGQALIHTTDFNNDLKVDFNEITGVSAGAGLQMISFVDIHGDIVTDLNADGTMTDADHNPTNGRDGKILLNSSIEKIELRSITAKDLSDTTSVSSHIALSSYSIFGNIYAGAGFGLSDGTGGLVIDNAGAADQAAKFSGASGTTKYVATVPEIGSIRVGTATSGQHFSFGVNPATGNNVGGQLSQFVPPAGSDGAGINGVKSVKSGGAVSTGPAFNIGTLQAGDGSFGGNGGSIANVHLNGDSAGGYSLIAGNGGLGNTGTTGGSITNFSDFGSVTGQILLKTGDGGRALLGAGGNAGTLEFDATNGQKLAGRVSIVLGSGGDGLTAGGNGASVPSAKIVTPETVTAYASTFISTTRLAGDIGTTRPIDFNGDGISDAVMTVNNPDQLQVLLGAKNPVSGQYGFDVSTIIYLNNPASPLAMVVADFNSDGNPDIAVASSDPSFAGVSVFLSLYSDSTDPKTFTGFSDPIYSALPSLQSAFFYQKAVPILNLAAGDFSGSGHMELALTAMETYLPPTANPNTNTVFFLKAATDSVTGKGSGHFYADMKTGGQTPFVPIGGTGIKAGTPFIFRPTALDTAVKQDTLLISQGGLKYITELSYDAFNFVQTSQIDLDQVDTNRKLNTKLPPDNEAKTDVTMQDFVVLDFENAAGKNISPGDGFADIVVLAKAPEGFLQTFAGDGTGNFNVSSVGPTAAEPIDNQGIKVSGKISDGGMGFENTDFVGLRALNDNSMALFDYGADGKFNAKVIKLQFAPTTLPNQATLLGTVSLYQPLQIDDGIAAFDIYRPNPLLNPTLVGYGYCIPSKDNYFDSYLQLKLELPAQATPPFYYLTHNSLFLTAGNGGDSLLGAGGAAGSIGGGSLSTSKTTTGTTSTTTITGKVSLTLPTDAAYQGNVRLVAGVGGNGFTNGGAGGSLSSISVDYATGTSVQTSGVLLIAGNGGSGNTGTGGAGGSLSQLTIQSGEVFVAGNGGFGIAGGAGGSIIGNGITGASDTTTASVSKTTTPESNTFTAALLLKAGSGANGITQGGAGGGITNFVPQFLPIVGGVGGNLNYFAGNGGNAVGGAGGAGGSIASSSPYTKSNNLAGDVYIQAGNGGNGISGGYGGGISNFVNKPTIDATLDSISMLAGNGGSGVTGSGGAGGSITTVNATGSGVGSKYVFDYTNQSIAEGFFDLVTGQTQLLYNRIIAGQGGESVSYYGGAGGGLSAITTTAASSASVVAAGAGGDGLRGGGAGGGISSSTVNSSGTDGKVLAIAGDGGDATGNLVLGGVKGYGGAGGGISSFVQPSSTDTKVDLIAGNGGSLLAYGTSADTTSNVGAGGSIGNVSITGNIGNSDANVAIKSYNNINRNEKMSDFIRNVILGDPSLPLTDSVGNVGLVVGEAGRVGDGTLGRGVANGSAGTITVQGDVMSMIAGNVERIAAIQALSGITVTQGHIVGAAKDVAAIWDPVSKTYNVTGFVHDPSNPLYLSSTNTTINAPQLGGKLLDGALVSYNAHAKINGSIRDFVL